MQHDPGYGHLEERVQALEQEFDRRILIYERAIEALHGIIAQQQEALVSLITQLTGLQRAVNDLASYHN